MWFKTEAHAIGYDEYRLYLYLFELENCIVHTACWNCRAVASADGKQKPSFSSAHAKAGFITWVSSHAG